MELSKCIRNILKHIDSEIFIKKNSIFYIQDLIYKFIKRIINICDLIINEHNLKFVNENTVKTTFLIITKKKSNNNLLKLCIKNCENSLKNFKEYDRSCFSLDRANLSNKSNLTISTNIIKKIVNQLSRTKINTKGLIYLSALIEYLICELLDISVKNTKKNGNKKITIESIEKSITDDIELNFILD